MLGVVCNFYWCESEEHSCGGEVFVRWLLQHVPEVDVLNDVQQVEDESDAMISFLCDVKQV